MEVKHLTLREMLTYGYCPMQWHLRYRLKLPWFAASPEVFFSQAVRFAVREYFRMQETNMSSRRAMSSATVFLEHEFEMMRHLWPTQSITNMGLHREGLLALLALPGRFDRSKDTLVAAPLKYSASVIQGSRAVTITGEMDAIFIRHDRTTSRSIISVTVTNSKDPHEDMVRWSDVRPGFAHYAVRRGLGQKYELPIRHLMYPVINKTPTIRGTGLQTMGFKKAALQVSLGMSAGYVMPAANPVKCNHCPYDSICSMQLASKTAEGVAEERKILIDLAKDRPIEEV